MKRAVTVLEEPVVEPSAPVAAQGTVTEPVTPVVEDFSEPAEPAVDEAPTVEETFEPAVATAEETTAVEQVSAVKAEPVKDKSETEANVEVT